MKKLICIRILYTMSVLFMTIHSKAQEIEWQNTIGGSFQEVFSSVSPTYDGGYICGGYSNSNISGDKTENKFGSFDYWVVKLDSNGNIEWENTIGALSSDQLFSVKPTFDGGYICGGISYSGISGDKTEDSIGWCDYWIVKLDSAGNIQWQNTIGGDSTDYLYSIYPTSDGGYICGGYSNSGISGDKSEDTIGVCDYWVVKLDSIGNIQWQNNIGGDGEDRLSSVSQTFDGGYICGGSSLSNISGDKSENRYGFGADYWVVKLDNSGSIQWQKTIGGDSDDWLTSVFETTDNGFICGGYSSSGITGNKTEYKKGLADYWLIKLDSTGNIQWQNSFGGDSVNYLFSIAKTMDGGIICGGHSKGNISVDKTENCLGGYDYWIVKLDDAGILEWQNTIGGSEHDFLNSISATADGNHILGGYSFSDISGDKMENCVGASDYWIVKLTSDYNSINGKVFIDANSNGIQDSLEFVLGNRKITELNSGRFTFSNQDGHYSLFVLDTGNFAIDPGVINFYNSIPAFYSVVFNGVHQIDSLNDFAFQPLGNYTDLAISLTPLGMFRSGFNSNYEIIYGNKGVTMLNGAITFYPDSNLTFVSSNITPTSINSDSIVWIVGLLSPYQTCSISITVHVQSGLPIGTLIYPTVQIDPIAGDAVPSNNQDAWEVYTMGSFDPNDIIVSDDTLTTAQLATDPYLEYIIRFQNTGNDTAFSVKILNPIDTFKLDLSTIEFVSSSHPVNLQYIPWERNMEFKFANILLPDSNINEPLSHGFVRYRIKPKTSLLAGDSITNYAVIFFDFNSPVKTNTAVTKIILPTTYSSMSVSGCNSYISPSGIYLWTSTGIYMDTLINNAGGDSILTIYLTIKNNTASVISPNVCESYTSPGGTQTWTTSGTYMDTIPNAESCDSIITIFLTIRNNSYSVVNENTCEGYTSPSGIYTWTTTGTYLDTIPNVVGCDSIITINLSINKSFANLILNSCESYSSPSGNYIWTISGNYLDTILNAAGCDSVIAINLTIDSVDVTITANPPMLIANAGGALYQWIYCDSIVIPGETGQSFMATSNGSYAVIVSQNGCMDTSACYTISNVNIYENVFSGDIRIYPNPVNHTLTILFARPADSDIHLNIFDPVGIKIYQAIEEKHNPDGYRKTIDVSNFSNGIYFVQLA